MIRARILKIFFDDVNEGMTHLISGREVSVRQITDTGFIYKYKEKQVMSIKETGLRQ